jgi:hypothetical protein
MQAEPRSSCWRRLATCFRTLDGYLEEKNQKVGSINHDSQEAITNISLFLTRIGKSLFQGKGKKS